LAGNEAYDIMIKGKKMGGNAQRYTRHALFQHGSIPIQIDKPRFETLFLGKSGLDDAATLEELGSNLSYEELTLLCKEAFVESFDVNTVDECLRPSEEQSARELLADKYTQQRWNADAEQDGS
jgi:lipoate-protein ligase A